MTAITPLANVTSIAARAPHVVGIARTEFFRVFNFATVAAAFYLCLCLAVARWLPMVFMSDDGGGLLESVRFLRQNLISGLTALVTIAAVQALLAGRQWPLGHALALGVPALGAAALLGAVLRLLAVDIAWQTIPQRWPWAVGIVALWTFVGSLGFLLAHQAQREQAARRALAAADCKHEDLEAQRVQAHLSALQAQIEPHFLFNTLANVKRLYETAPERGRAMLTHLIEYLRAALPSMRQAGSTVQREAELARSFLTILQMRMGERLRFSIEIDPAVQQAMMPPLVLATLIENAIKHGLSPLPAGGCIDIAAWRDGEFVLVEVRDTGGGFAAGTGSGVGLANTRARLAALYGSRANLHLEGNTPRGLVARVRLPLQWSTQQTAASFEAAL